MQLKRLCVLGWVLLVLASGQLLAGEADRVWFGLGGSSGGLLFPELDAVNGFLIDDGFAALPEVGWTSGGRGRGGWLHGPSIGGVGWGASLASQEGDRVAELDVGFGGIEVGYVVGGDERSLLTLGLVLGGGGSALTLREVGDDSTCSSFTPSGIVVGPITLTAASAFVAIEPFVSFQVQPVPFIGFELQIGYLLPVAGFEWGDFELEGPGLRPEGPAVSASITWGAIGRWAIGRWVTEGPSEQTVEHTLPLDGACVAIEGGMGEIVVEQDLGLGTALQTPSHPRVEVVALKRAMWGADLDDVEVLVEPSKCGLRIYSVGPESGQWGVDYVVRIPANTELQINHGSGSVQLIGLRASASIGLGVGSVSVVDLDGESLLIDAGIGEVMIAGVTASTIDVLLGVGDVELALRPSASYGIDASVGIGSVEIESFPGLDAARSAGFGAGIEATLGEGTGSLTIDLGIGKVGISPLL